MTQTTATQPEKKAQRGRTFAYGRDTNEDEDGHEVSCPAVKALNIESTGEIAALNKISGRFDEEMVEGHYVGEGGVVTEAEAREAWLAAIKWAEEKPRIPKNTAEYGRKVARELGWIES